MAGLQYSYVRGDRLSMWASPADESFWTENWDRLDDRVWEDMLRPVPFRLPHERRLSDALPAGEWVLEAGCGPGRWVRRLDLAGHLSIGVDYSVSTLVKAKGIHPPLRLMGADIGALPFPDSSLGGYLSFGVIEHFEEGPRAALLEAARVVRPGGAACFSVPYVNRQREKTDALTSDQARDEGLRFYQHYFSFDELSRELEAAGFAPSGSPKYLASITTLRGIVPGARAVLRRWPALNRFTPVLDLLKPLGRRYGHMLWVVARRR